MPDLIQHPPPDATHFWLLAHRRIIEAQIYELLDYIAACGTTTPLVRVHMLLLHRLRRKVMDAERASRRLDDDMQQ